MLPIEFDMVVFKEGNVFITYSPKLDVSSCGNTFEQARENMKAAVRLFLEEAERMGTLEDILAEAGYCRGSEAKWNPPRMVGVESVELP